MGAFQMSWAMFVVRTSVRFHGDKSPTTNPVSTEMKHTHIKFVV
jgi:hypothetical protein